MYLRVDRELGSMVRIMRPSYNGELRAFINCLISISVTIITGFYIVVKRVITLNADVSIKSDNLKSFKKKLIDFFDKIN
ncbi:hypothetical protein BpHYR1_036581 [Brachionus plicatilis]|uniref:Uncharacterized protein n=1 Tax=Brachionus plicatilis TaxID=10195 RepID=A0A3M7QER0_BRAPC|nr:hypothetical protein BpHYR1_036581 [Brachionus plicatilis]